MGHLNVSLGWYIYPYPSGKGGTWCHYQKLIENVFQYGIEKKPGEEDEEEDEDDEDFGGPKKDPIDDDPVAREFRLCQSAS